LKCFKAVIPAAGLGTRLLPVTKEQPKEMLPIFSRSIDGKMCVKPFLQVVFEKLYDSGSRDFCFVVGRGKRSIEDHFTLDSNFLYQLAAVNKIEPLNELSRFYGKVNNSDIVFINQPNARGFGDAVFRARGFTGKDPFIVHAGDDLIVSTKNQYVRRLVDTFLTNDAEAVFFVERVKHPQNYGVIEGIKVSKNLHRVVNIEEKPRFPKSNLAIIAIYVFSPLIYEAINCINPSGNEIQLTDAIHYLIDQGYPVYGLELKRGEKRVDIGTPQSYWNVLKNMQKTVSRSSIKSITEKELVDFQFNCPISSDRVEAHGTCTMCPKLKKTNKEKIKIKKTFTS
jgi:UTP--glucose-1-phosphate uridylyltransferase